MCDLWSSVLSCLDSFVIRAEILFWDLLVWCQQPQWFLYVLCKLKHLMIKLFLSPSLSSSVQPNAKLWENSDLYARTCLPTSDNCSHLLLLVCSFYANFTTFCDEESDKWEDIALLCTLCISTSGVDLRCGWGLHLFLISIHQHYHKLCGKRRSFCDEARHGYETIVGFVV